MLEAYKQQIMLAVAAGAENLTSSTIAIESTEEMMEKIEEIFGDDSQMLDFYEQLFKKITIEDGELKMTSATRPPAICP